MLDFTLGACKLGCMKFTFQWLLGQNYHTSNLGTVFPHMGPCRGMLFTFLHLSVNIVMNMSLWGCKTHSSDHQVQGLWLLEEMSLYINVLELGVVLRVCTVKDNMSRWRQITPLSYFISTGRAEWDSFSYAGGHSICYLFQDSNGHLQVYMDIGLESPTRANVSVYCYSKEKMNLLVSSWSVLRCDVPTFKFWLQYSFPWSQMQERTL